MLQALVNFSLRHRGVVIVLAGVLLGSFFALGNRSMATTVPPLDTASASPTIGSAVIKAR
jgi:multidrug efflux pump subunit AcrB